MARPQETLGGRYELLDVLGRGGMGVVYRARDSMLDRIVAVKVLPAALAEVGSLVERFEREARAAARLNHPNIVGVYDTGIDRGARYIVMECVPGQSLDQRIAEGGPLGAPRAVEIAAEVASALAAAHAAGIIHRDIKPGNIMVQPTASIKVLDFGIARATSDAALTSTTTLLGSVPYMAPEVALGQPADARSDIYSLGCVLYEMLTGRPPFIGDLPVAVMNQHTSTPPRPPREFDPSIPAGVEALVLQMLAKAPEERPQQAAPLVSALPASLRAPVAPGTLATQAIPPATASTQMLEPATAATRWRSPEKAAVGAAAAGAAAAGAAAAAAAESRPPTRRPPPRSSGVGRPWVVVLAVVIALAAGVAVAVALVNSSGSTRSSSSSAPPPSAVSTGGGQSSSASSTQSTQSTTQSHSTPTTSSTPTTTSTPTTSTGATTPTTPTGTTAPTGTTTAP